ncbi:hypothetical protein [Chloroflexus aggregans]|uniref:3-keto-disaccharide hydrolase domain-containing protein n=1 Tax=Chloroflexus aggregans (strain MD-66 / DSM 9485) TaxID=326427 RepID=B8G8U1_CHLAD|nr:hypothetical protein [Chloroflexus aggregans]ACL26216.1 conserved hypothetical protein [Chloroflexus aggregans DSM 9485]
MQQRQLSLLRLSLTMILVAIVGRIWLSLRPGQAEEGGPLLQYPPEPPAPTIGPNPTVPAGLASGPRFVADFTAADSLNGWQIVDLDFIMPEDRANWIVADGRLQQYFAGEFNDSRPFQTVALAPGEYTDAMVRVSFYDAFNGVAGLVARYQGEVGYEASYYRLRLLKHEYEATPKYVLEKVVDGVATPLATLEGPGFAPRQWHVIELDVRGGALVARLNGKVLLQATDSQPLPAGRVGVYSRALGGMLFDDFLVTP